MLLHGLRVVNGDYFLAKPFEILEDGEESLYPDTLMCHVSRAMYVKIGEIRRLNRQETYNDLLNRFIEEYKILQARKSRADVHGTP